LAVTCPLSDVDATPGHLTDLSTSGRRGRLGLCWAAIPAMVLGCGGDIARAVAISTSAASTGTGGGLSNGGGGGLDEASGCEDGLLNGAEVAIDCGGAECAPCPGGTACGSATDCISQLCVDGVCCDGACNGICFACGSDGVCAPASTGTDPHDDCAATDACSETTGLCGCNDGVQGTDERGVDCGGPCPLCGASETACTDGTDDDGDGTADCADPDCAVQVVCAAAVPDGWTGPAILYLGSAPPNCPANWGALLLDGQANVYGPEAACSACACGAPQGAECTLESTGSISLFATTDCSGAPQTHTLSAGCNDIPTSNALSFATAPAHSLGGSCVIGAGGVASIPPATSLSARVCAGASASTSDCGLCLPLPPGPFGKHPCVHRTGDVECPDTYPDRTVVFSGSLEDTRGCSDCACGEVNDGTCSGNTQIDKYDGCIEQTTGAPNPSDCRAVEGVQESIYLTVLDFMFDGWCEPSGGHPTGSVTGSEPTTVCCTE